jgi:hypothetical protein
MVKKEEFESVQREALYWRGLCIKSVLKKDVTLGRLNWALLMAVARGFTQEQVDEVLKQATEAWNEHDKKK